jgi:DNA-sulfur modification-associated
VATQLSGYTTSYDFWGTHFQQLGLKAISLHITIDQITAGFIQRPDPNAKLSHNRAIKPTHADDFASYLLRGAEDESGKWNVIVPALSLFTSPHSVTFEPREDIPAGDISFGIVRIDKTEPVKIWDGQHRTLGAYIAIERLNKKVSEALNAQATAEADGQVERANQLALQADSLRMIRRKLGQLVIPVAIALETNEQRIAELFADVADNAKGINATALARLDQRNVFNRAATAMYEGRDDWSLLEGLIDDDNASVTQNNPHWTTYRDVAAVAQTAFLGYGARWTENKEESLLSDAQLEILVNAREFYEALAAAFPDVDDVLTGTIEPNELRGGGSRTSLLSSSTTIRALASAWYDLRYGHRWTKAGSRTVSAGLITEPWTPQRITAAFARLPSMDAGSDKVLNRFWKSLDIIEAPYAAPTARAGNIRILSMAIVEHAESEAP